MRSAISSNSAAFANGNGTRGRRRRSRRRASLPLRSRRSHRRRNRRLRDARLRRGVTTQTASTHSDGTAGSPCSATRCRARRRTRCDVQPPSSTRDAWMCSISFAAASGSTSAGSQPGQPEDHRRVGRMALAGERERAIQIDATRATPPSGPRASSSRTNRWAAVIGPIVCELDGPMPILNRSKTLT